MSRYIGPRVKKLRSFGVDLPGLSRKSMDRRPTAPGQHGPTRRRKISDYGRQLAEKQKLRYNYGLGERQFRRLILEARKSKLGAGDKLLELLERRLDNVVFRAGFAATIPAARQLVAHGHITVNDVRTDRPSFHVKPGVVVAIHEKSKAKPFIQAKLEHANSRVRPGFLEFDPAKAAGKLVVQPEREDLPFECDPQKIVEFYSQQI